MLAGGSNPIGKNTNGDNNSVEKTTDMMANTNIISPADLARNAPSSEVPRIELLELDVCKSGNQATCAAEKNIGEGNGVARKDDVRKGAGCEVSGGGGVTIKGASPRPQKQVLDDPDFPPFPAPPSSSRRTSKC